jgi:hypothetical protein
MVKGRRKGVVIYGIEGFTGEFCFTSGKICVHVPGQTYHHHVFFLLTSKEPLFNPSRVKIKILK